MDIDAKLPQNLQDIRDFVEWTVRYYEHARDVEREFRGSMQNDGKIDSAEASNIKKEIVDLVGGLALLATHYIGKYDEPFEAAPGVAIQCDGNEFQVSFQTDDLGDPPFEGDEFEPWFQKFVREDLRNYFNSILEFLADEVISEDEKPKVESGLAQTLKPLLFAAAYFQALSEK